MVRPWLVVWTRFHTAPVFGRIGVAVGLLGAYSALVVLVDKLALGDWINIQASLHGLLGLVLGMLLVFRTNTAYERWWEGRKLWGQLVNDSRNLAIKVHACVRTDAAAKLEFGELLINFARALKDHLRGGVRLRELETMSASAADPSHVPVWISRSLYERLAAWRQADQLDGFDLLVIDRHAAGLLDVCGACERIRRTPLAKSYRWFLRQLISIYLVTLPWALLEDFGAWEIPTVMLIGYFMIGIETIAEDIEEPFGTDADDLRLDDLCRTIDASVREILTEAPAA